MVTVPDSLIFLEGQCSFMADAGHDVIVISSPSSRLRQFAESENVRATELPMTRAVTPLADLVALWRLIQLLRKMRPDIVHAHTPKAGLLAMIAARLVGAGLCVYHIHGLPFETATGMRRRLLVATEWISCHLAHHVLCVSQSALDVAKAAGVCPRNRGLVLGSGSINGVDTELKFNPLLRLEEGRRFRATVGIPQGDPVIGYLGRVVRDKGIHDLAAAWDILRVSHPRLHLLLVGPEEQGDPVDNDVLLRLRGDSRVHMTGPVSDPAPTLAAMCVLVLPSHREGFGLAALEGSAMGVPVVGTSIAGMRDAVADGRTGTLVEPRSPAMVASAVARYLQDGALRSKHGSAGRARACASFRQDDMWQSLDDVYHRFLNERASR